MRQWTTEPSQPQIQILYIPRTPTYPGIQIINTIEEKQYTSIRPTFYLIERCTIMKGQEQEKEPICIECDKKNQKDLPESDGPTSASEGMPCESPYAKVTRCMSDNAGQITACRKEWDSFKLCHKQNKK
jgi:hypothetical protein